MKIHTSLRLSPFFVITLLIFVSLISSPATAQDEAIVTSHAVTSSEGLFTDSTTRSSVATPEQAVRTRVVTADFAPLGGTNSRTASHDTISQQLTLNLFDDVVITAQLERFNQNHLGTASWIGRAATSPASDIILVSNDGVMAGVIFYENKAYEIRYGGNGTHLIHEIDQSKFEAHPPGWEAFVASHAQGISQDPAPRTADVASDDGTLLDILIAYTDDARSAAGGTAAMEALAQLSVDTTNVAYENSAVTQRLYLVHTVEYSYAETGDMYTDLPRLSGKSDGYFDDVHDLRDTYHADLVMLLTEDGGGFCGLASLQTNISSSFESSAFNVTDTGCAGSNLTPAHEIGHNMGLRHDWYVDTGTTPATYAHGHNNPSEGWRSVMSYNNYCSALGQFCVRLPYFSNPDLDYDGNPLGIEGGTSTSCQSGSTSPAPNGCDADAARLQNESGPTAAAWRASQITWIGNTTDWNSASNWSIDLGAPSSAVATARVPLNIDDVYIPASPTGGNFPTLNSGTAYARNVVLEDGASLTISGGTLEVQGHWEENGNGGSTTSTAGTVKFVGQLDQTITMRDASTLPNVEIGNGSTSQSVSFDSNIDIDGNLTLLSGVSATANNYTINLAGNLDDQAGELESATSTFIFDGSNQSVSSTTSGTLFTEDFAGFTSCCSTALPSGWESTGDHDTFNIISGDDMLWHWSSSSDAWVFTPAFEFNVGKTYTLHFDHRKVSGTSSITAGLSPTQSSTDMTTIGSIANGDISTSFQTASFTFEVATSGTYYIGVNSIKTGSYNQFDDFSITWERPTQFYNLQVASGQTTFSNPVKIENNLQIDSGATADFGTHEVTVETAVTNNGSLKQTQTVEQNTQADFLHIQNTAADSQLYYGVEITPTSGDMGETTVTIDGNQLCDGTGTPTIGVLRCYEITPTADQTADVRFYYTSAEVNGNLNPDTFNESDDDVWTEEGSGSQGGSGDGLWLEASGVDSYGTFAVVEDQIRVTLSGTKSYAETDSSSFNLVLTATLNLDADAGFTIPYTISDGTAETANSDYSGSNGTLSFTGDQDETETITIQINGDTVTEEDETIIVTLGDPSDGDIVTSGTPFTVTITNDDVATITLAGGATQTEGDAGTVDYTFTATLSNDVQDSFTVGYNTSDDTAEAGSDYTDNDGTFSFTGMANEEKTFTVSVSGDDLVEIDEQFLATLATPSHSNVSISGSPQIGIIRNDESATITLSGSHTITEGNSGTTAMVFTATLSANVQDGVTVPYATNDDTAVAGNDYTDNDGTLSFSGSANEVELITVLVTGDNTEEANETFTVSLGTPSHSAVSTAGSPQTGTINNDDETSYIFLPAILK